MRTEISAGEISNYRTNGFLILRALLDDSEVVELKTAVLAAVDSMGERKIAGEGADLTATDDYYDRIFTQRLNLWRISEVVRCYLQAERLGRLLCDLEGIDGVRVWHDQALIKEPFANATPLHLDNPYWSFTHSTRSPSGSRSRTRRCRTVACVSFPAATGSLVTTE